jgi:hypothetical protein
MELSSFYYKLGIYFVYTHNLLNILLAPCCLKFLGMNNFVLTRSTLYHNNSVVNNGIQTEQKVL